MILILSTNTASALHRYDEKIYEGDAYQINNYLIEVDEIKTYQDHYLLTIKMYQLKSDGTNKELTTTSKKDIDDNVQIEYKDDGVEIQVNEKNVTSRYAIIDIATSGISVEYEKYIEGGISKAEFIGEPLISLTKEVDKTNVEIGDTIRVTIKARNEGSGPAARIKIDYGITPGFTFKSGVYTTYPTELAVENAYTQMYIYEIEAAQGGTFSLNPATVNYFCSTFDSEYSSLSNSPEVTVVEEAVETSELELTATCDKTELKRGDIVKFTVSVRNIKDVPATAIRIDLAYPYDLSYKSGSEGIRIIDDKPVVQENIFGARYETEYHYSILADEVGVYNITAKLTYNDGVENIDKEASDIIYVEEGEYDYLKEYPIYFYITPIIIITAVVGWLYWRRSQFRM